MSDLSHPTSWANVTHAVLAHGVGACRVENMAAPDGGPLYVLTLIGRCRCGREDEADLEQSALLRDTDVVNVLAALTGVARDAGLGDTLADRVEAVIEATQERCGPDRGGELVVTCTRCEQQVGDCRCTAWIAADA